MKKIVLFLAILTLIVCSSAQADSCVVPKFLKEGAIFWIRSNAQEAKLIKIVEIDKKSCWIKIKKVTRVQNMNAYKIEKIGVWLNLNTIDMILPEPSIEVDKER